LPVLRTVLADDGTDGRAGVRRQDVLDAAQRVVRDVETEVLPLEGELDLLLPLDVGDRGQRDDLYVDLLATEPAEQTVLPDGLLLLLLGESIDIPLVHGDQTLTWVVEIVERTALDERLDGALVADDGGALAQEVLEGGELALLLAGGHDAVDDVGADVADRRQAEADVLADSGEVGDRLVDIRW